MIIDVSIAGEKAQTYLTSVIEGESNINCTLVLTKVREDADGWYFPYQSKEFLDTGNFDKSLVGNWPIFVSRDGAIVEPRRPGILSRP